MPGTTVFSPDAPDGASARPSSDERPPPGRVAASLASIAAIGVALPLLLGGCSALFRPAPPQPGGVDFTEPLRVPASRRVDASRATPGSSR